MAELPVCNICKCSANSEVTHSGNFAFHYNNHCPWAGARMREEQWTKLMGQGEPVAEVAEINGQAIVYWDKSLPVGTKLFTHPAPAVDDGAVLDAARYRWLREQHWHDGRAAVVMSPKESVKLGRFCPSGSTLDAVIDNETKEQQDAKADN